MQLGVDDPGAPRVDADVDHAARVVDSLRHIVSALRASSHVLERELGISGAQLFVLRELAAEPDISIKRLSERTLTDPSSVSVVVARLVERRLVSRRRADVDARASVLSLTARGRQLLARAPEPFQAELVAALRALPRPRLRQLDASLQEVVIAAGAGGGAAPMFFHDKPRTRSRRDA